MKDTDNIKEALWITEKNDMPANGVFPVSFQYIGLLPDIATGGQPLYSLHDAPMIIIRLLQ